jgi:hypothetical protein
MYDFSRDRDLLRWSCVLYVYNVSGNFFYFTAIRIVLS